MIPSKLILVTLLAILVSACGPSKKVDQGDDGGTDGLGRTGQGQGDGNRGERRTPPPPSFDTYCSSLRGGWKRNDNNCQFLRDSMQVKSPEAIDTVFQQSIGSVRWGNLVETYGGATGGATLYASENGNLTPFLSISEKLSSRLVDKNNIGLTLVATAPFGSATIKIWEYVNQQHNSVNCL